LIFLRLLGLQRAAIIKINNNLPFKYGFDLLKNQLVKAKRRHEMASTNKPVLGEETANLSKAAG